MNNPHRAVEDPSAVPAQPEVFRLDRESLRSCQLNLTGFQSLDDANRIAAQLCSTLATALSRFLDLPLDESHGEALDPLKQSIQTLKDLFQIQRATPGTQGGALKEFSSMEMRLDRFLVYVNVMDGVDPKKMGFADWVQVKHEAVELKFAMLGFCEKHPEGGRGSRPSAEGR